MLHETTPQAYVAPVFSVPSQRTPNKSGSGLHQVCIKDRGEIGPAFYGYIEYTAKHNLSLGTIDVEVGCMAEVYAVKFEWRENGKEGFIEESCGVNERLAKRHCDYLLNCYTDIEDRIAEEIRCKLAAG